MSEESDPSGVPNAGNTPWPPTECRIWTEPGPGWDVNLDSFVTKSDPSANLSPGPTSWVPESPPDQNEFYKVSLFPPHLSDD